MFTYLDPKIREQLIAQDKLLRINARGQRLPDVAVSDPDDGTALNLLGPIPLPVTRSASRPIEAQWYVAVRSTELGQVETLASQLREAGGGPLFSMLATSMAVNSVLITGDPKTWKNPLVRVHSSCLTGDVFGSQRCECGPQLESALEQIAGDPAGGMLIYMAGHEGRGIGLWAKAATYLLQDEGQDTYQANQLLGLPDDSRDFTDAATLLHHFVGNNPFRLMTNNPKKIDDLTACGLTDITPVKHLIGVNPRNRRYLEAKRNWGHRLDDSDLVSAED
ncbi:MAG: GTP cyclohydrolase II [Lysobacterales bacterium]